MKNFLVLSSVLFKKKFYCFSFQQIPFVPQMAEEILKMEESFLTKQKENMQKVDALVEKAEKTLQAIKLQFETYLKTSEHIVNKTKMISCSCTVCAREFMKNEGEKQEVCKDCAPKEKSLLNECACSSRKY